MIRASDLKFTAIRFHRNGCGGAGFYVVLFQDLSDGPVRFLRAVVFDAAEHCAVTDADYRAAYRGDAYEPHIRAFIASQAAQDRAFG